MRSRPTAEAPATFTVRPAIRSATAASVQRQSTATRPSSSRQSLSCTSAPNWCESCPPGTAASPGRRGSCPIHARSTGKQPESRSLTAKPQRSMTCGLPCVLGHADFEAQNLRWHGREVWAVHDWDSLAWQPEAALAGAASGAFVSAGPPTLAAIESSKAFPAAYQDTPGACSRQWSRRSRGRPACGWPRTTPARRHCTAIPPWAAMRSAHKQPNASVGLMPSTSMRVRDEEVVPAACPNKLSAADFHGHSRTARTRSDLDSCR